MSNFRPLADRVVVEPVAREEMTKSGIVLPETSKEKPQEGVVVAVGQGKVLENGEHVPPEVKEGDRIIYSKFSGTEFKNEGKDFLILSERDILAVIR